MLFGVDEAACATIRSSVHSLVVVGIAQALLPGALDGRRDEGEHHGGGDAGRGNEARGTAVGTRTTSREVTDGRPDAIDSDGHCCFLELD